MNSVDTPVCDILERASASSIQAVAGLTDLDLEKPLCDCPGGPQGRPFGETLWWTNRELIVAGAEIGLLRGLHRPDSTPAGGLAEFPPRP